LWMLAEAWVKHDENLFRFCFGQGIRTVMTTGVGIICIDSNVFSWSRIIADGMTSARDGMRIRMWRLPRYIDLGVDVTRA
jgi:hypothetical protein